ncbi:MAG: DNA polymerase III subunit beta [Pseudomonadota bacterium]
MRLIIERSALLKGLNHVTSVVERRNTIPILSNVLLEVDSGELKLTATDLEREVVESIASRGLAPGAITVSAHMLHDIVRKLPDGAEIEIESGVEDGRMTLSSGQSRFSLQALPASDFPKLDAGDLEHRFQIPAKDLRRLIEKTRFAISTEETRYYLNGIYLHEAASDVGQTLRAVATDGHRLAQVEFPRPEGVEGMPGVIVPRKTVVELHRLVEESENSVDIGLSQAKIRFETGSIVLTSKLIDGTFPDYGRVIPQGNDKVMSFANAEFASAVDRVSTLSHDKGRAVKLNIESGQLTLSVHNPDSGSAMEDIKVEYDSEPLEIGFNAKYLLDISALLEGEKAYFRLADAGSPTMVKEVGDETALYVLMPMRV